MSNILKDSKELFIGIDCGSTSVRGGLFTNTGDLIRTKTVPISSENHSQDCEEIWNGICLITKALVEGINPAKVKGIAFDATCSLVSLDKDYNPSAKIIMWMDHRAVNEAKMLSETNHEVLKQCGGRISPEMSVAKVCFVYRNERAIYENTSHFVELPDWLVFKAVGPVKNSIPRSLNSLVCKWGYDSKGRKWYDDFWSTCFPESELPKLYEKIGAVDGWSVHAPGEKVSRGLSERAAKELGLCAETAVGGSLIDAYAGCLGTIGIDLNTPDQLESRLAIIAGTSACHIALSKDSFECKGVWGPYDDVLIPGFSCLEGGQSFTGRAIEIFLLHHPYQYELRLEGQALFEKLNQMVEDLGEDAVSMTKNVHILPDVHGNRCPLADPDVKGSWIGISTYDQESFVILYLSLLISLAFSTKDIIKAMRLPINELYLSGGLASNGIWLQILADVTKSSIYTGKCEEPVLLGTAICAMSAHNGSSLMENMKTMASVGEVYRPSTKNSEFLDKKFQVFKEIVKDQYKYRNIMD